MNLFLGRLSHAWNLVRVATVQGLRRMSLAILAAFRRHFGMAMAGDRARRGRSREARRCSVDPGPARRRLRGLPRFGDGAALQDARPNPLLDDVVRLRLLEVALYTLDCFGVDRAHVVAHFVDPNRLKETHDRLRIEVELLCHFVNAHLAHRTSRDLHA
jgi:hypothetical protein